MGEVQLSVGSTAELWRCNELSGRSELSVTGSEQVGAGYPRLVAD